MNNLNNQYELLDFMNDISYGYMDKDENIHKEMDNSFADNFALESYMEVLNNKIGICWDQVELERYFFENKNIKHNTYFIVHYDNDKCPTHTFLIYEDNNKYYWFEHSWELYSGIHEYDSEELALKDIKNKFIKSEIDGEYNPMNLCIYKYDKPNSHIDCAEFYKHCESGINIII